MKDDAILALMNSLPIGSPERKTISLYIVDAKAEVERLRAENAELDAKGCEMMDLHQGALRLQAGEVERLRAENASIARARDQAQEMGLGFMAEVERLRAALDEAKCAECGDKIWVDGEDGKLHVANLRAEEAKLTKAIAALESYRNQHNKDLGMECHCPPCLVARQTLKEIR